MDKYNEAWTQLVNGNVVGAEATIHEHLKGVKDDKHAIRLLEIIQHQKKQDKTYVNTYPY
jgi:hypothetical protein